MEKMRYSKRFQTRRFFVKVFGQVRTSMNDNDKVYSNVKVLSSKYLKVK